MKESGETNKQKLESALEETLSKGDMERADPGEGAKARLNTRYEYRIQAERDPIAEETKIIRKMAKEPDGRYDRWAEENVEK